MFPRKNEFLRILVFPEIRILMFPETRSPTFWGILATLWGHYGDILATLWGHFGDILGILWGQFGDSFEAFLGHFAPTLRPLWGHFWGHFGTDLSKHQRGGCLKPNGSLTEFTPRFCAPLVAGLPGLFLPPLYLPPPAPPHPL